MFKELISGAIFCVVVNTNAQTILFSTDFVTKPAGISELSQKATTNKGEKVIVEILADGNAPKDTTIDGMKFTVSWENQKILISSASQKPVQTGDPGASNGRISIKNSNCSVTLPAVPGPCTITYYAAGSSSSAGKGITCKVNGNTVPEAGFDDLALDSVQATRKMTYTAAIGGDVIFELVGRSGVYLYDIEIVSSDVASVNNGIVERTGKCSLKFTGTSILNEKSDVIQIFDAMGSSVLMSENPVVNIQSLVKGMYIVRGSSNQQSIRIIR